MKMYHGKYAFAFIGGEYIYNMVKDITPIADSEYAFELYDPVTEFDSITDRHDSAVIVAYEGLNDNVCRKLDGMKKTFRILCVTAERFMSLDNDFLASFDTFWIVTLSNADILLNQYFCQLCRQLVSEFERRIYKICLMTTIDSLPDMVWFKDLWGLHLILNDGFCKATGKTKEQASGRGHYYIWDMPEEEYAAGDYVCLESEQTVIDAGKTCLFDEKVKTKEGMRFFRTYKSPLYDEDGSLFGTCGVARDMTDLRTMSDELEVVLKSVPFGIVIRDTAGKTLSVNSEFIKYFPQCADMTGSDSGKWKQYAAFVRKLDSGEEEIRANGDPERIMLYSESPITDVFGNDVGAVSVFKDITTERLYEKLAAENMTASRLPR